MSYRVGVNGCDVHETSVEIWICLSNCLYLNHPKTADFLRCIRGGRGCGSGSGSTIWERHKRNGARLKTISKRTIRLRSGIRFEINAVLHSFKSFHQIAPSHRRHIPARRERLLKQGCGFLRSPNRQSPKEISGFSKLNAKGASTAKQSFHPIVYDVKLRFLLSKSVFAGESSDLSKLRKQRSAFSKNLSERVCGWLR